MTLTSRLMSPGDRRILCVGDFSGGINRSDLRFFRELPDAEFVNLGVDGPQEELESFITLTEALRRYKVGVYEMVVYGRVPAYFRNPRKGLLSNIARCTRSLFSPKIALKCCQAIRLLRVFSPKLVIIDLEDRPIIDNSRFNQAFHARLYFKRELPQNPANSFLYTTAKNEDNGNISRQPLYEALIGKLRPISIGVETSLWASAERGRSEKTADVFFCGKVHGRPNRIRGAVCLKQLKEDGFRIDFPEKGISHSEFLQRCANALTVWSPEGFGYECYRTYEAAALGAVPVLQYPTIQRHAPLVDGVHALYYGVEEYHMHEVLSRALTDRERLLKMGRAAQSHVGLRHTHAALSESIRETLRAL